MLKKVILIVCVLTCSLYATDVEKYWNQHTVNSREFKTAEESAWYLSYRNEKYPLFGSLMFPDFESLDGKIVVDYGCGPGNDVVNFLINSSAKKIYGIDVSEKAIELAKKRVALHFSQGHNSKRVEFLKVSDDLPSIPLPDNSVDYINCCGVLMNLSHPDKVLKEFHRILKPGGKVRVMVYNNDSIFTHLYVGYQKMVLGQPINHVTVTDKYYDGSENSKYTLSEMFKKCTDGEECPVSFNYTPQQFIELGQKCNFETKLIGVYFFDLELKVFKRFYQKLSDLPFFDKINPESRNFIKNLTIGADGYPKYKGENAGIGGVYELTKTA